MPEFVSDLKMNWLPNEDGDVRVKGTTEGRVFWPG
jgi:hypothetical protein